jgi:hypothetical protein
MIRKLGFFAFFGGVVDKLIKFGYSETTSKIWPIFHLKFDATKFNQKVKDGPNFYGLLRISEL